MSLLVLLSMPAISQRVALVLSGGGAKGLAHVGVLKALEDYEVPVDYIVGTSMGAVVGGLYASGYSPDSIAMILSSDKYKNWATGAIDDKYTYYFKQQAPDASWINIKFNYDDVNRKVTGKFPATLIPSFGLDFNVLELYADASAASSYDFNQLFIPFRCVAAEIDSNQSVIFSDGQLGTAIRASMTFPFYLKPIEVNGKLLFDGGMYNNFPADVAISEFNPDVVIGSKAAGNYDAPGEDDLISQLQSMLMTPADFNIDSSAGILLEHTLNDRTIFDFSRADEVISVGYKTVTDNLDGIYNLVHRRASAVELEKKRDVFFSKKPAILIDSIHITGLNKSQAEYVRRLFKRKEPVVDIESIKIQYFKLIADDMISSIFPELVYNNKSGYFDLYLRIKKSENFVGSLGGNISSGTSNEAFFGLEYRHLGRQAINLKTNLYLGRFYNSWMLGGRMDFPSRIPVFMKLEYFYNSKNYFRNTVYFFDDKTPSFLINKESFGSFSTGIPATNRGKLVIGINYGGKWDEYYQQNIFSREDTADITSFDIVSPRILFELNSLNRKQYASAGARFFAQLRYVQGTEKHTPGSTSKSRSKEENINEHSWFQLHLLYDNYFDHVGPVTFGFFGELLVSNQAFFDNYTSSLLAAPSFEPVLESKTLFLPKYRAYSYGAAGMKVILDVYRKVDLRLEGYLFQPYKEILADERLKAEYGAEFEYRSVIASSSVVWHSPLGPLSMSVNYYDRNNDKFSFFFNFGYIIFNKSICD
ncbi:MAG: patatin-like phospholipase family protein [Bacteroidota bacterium]